MLFVDDPLPYCKKKLSDEFLSQIMLKKVLKICKNDDNLLI